MHLPYTLVRTACLRVDSDQYRSALGAALPFRSALTQINGPPPGSPHNRCIRNASLKKQRDLEESTMNANNRLWRWLGLICVLSFGALGYLGWQIYLSAPPIPAAVVTTAGDVIFTGEQIQRGQQAWLAAGGQQLGTVWGHGSYVAPDWSADWLHREATTLQAILAAAQRKATPTSTEADQAAVGGRVRDEMRRNTYDESTGVLEVSPARARAIRE